MKWLKSRMERTEERISELAVRTTEINQSEQQRENKLKKNNKDLWDFNKSSNVLVTGILEGEKKNGTAEKYSKK